MWSPSASCNATRGHHNRLDFRGVASPHPRTGNEATKTTPFPTCSGVIAQPKNQPIDE